MELHSEYPEIVAELEAMRPRPRPDFAAELDARVAAGFAIRGAPELLVRSARANGSSGLSWRRVAGPVGALALVAIVVATAVISISESGPAAGERATRRSPRRLPRDRAQPAPSDSGANLNEFSQKRPAGGRLLGGDASDGLATRQPRRRSRSYRPLRRTEQGPRHRTLGPGHARRRSRRRPLGGVGDVLATVHAYDGIVLRSSVRTRREGRRRRLLRPPDPEREARRRARRLLGHRAGQLPLRRLGRRHGADDRARGTGAGLAGEDREPARRARRARRPTAERESVEAELRSERNRLARVRSQAQLRCNGAPTSPGSRCGSSPTPTPALGRRRRLGSRRRARRRRHGSSRIAAGVTLIALAVLAPIALILLLALGRAARLGPALARARPRPSADYWRGLTESSCSE